MLRCPPSPAAAISTPKTSVGTSIAATSASARSPSVSASRLGKTLGAGLVASIRAVIRGRETHGTAATFDQARVEFEEAWRVFLSNRTESDFQEWRAEQAFTAWKYRMWDTAGYRLPTQSTDGRSTAFAAPASRSATCPTTSVAHIWKRPDEIRR